ncbi:methyltransferase domain-containing protein [Pseudomonas sp. RTC3]|nr:MULTISPECIES: methyltransferase domain-containing protein [unclassified Pseudomonas]MEB0064754.1 methyltransferase domain-containing protein [Pseudomonas sp. RTC3]MDY7565135.1 methyltransferase domain-containing protein [Pseudomonas sp. 5C2]MEB0025145.1 methyltransferase domain-containing protein [Pseudomonas sp. MH9.2]MEB0150494.1 methyltransferase domain-containing protein [Pseudomonas sp. CCC2.2]MEB0243264.1 methyltransferase domain-containing protein [Pseudomonas sp. 5C2]
MSDPIKLKFSEKYDQEQVSQYFLKHQDGLARRLFHLRNEHLARKALSLAGEPGLVLDLPCGAGRFWPLLAEKSNRVIIGADHSADMIETACKSQSAEVVKRVRALQMSAFEIDLPDNSVDSIFCMRLLHHIGERQHRLTVLKEFYRATRETLIISLWVDGNFKSWKRKRQEACRRAGGDKSDYQKRFVIPRETAEREFKEAGFRIQKRLDFIPLYDMWRVYVLRKD